MHFEKFISSDRVCIHGYYIIYGKTPVHLTVDYNFEEICFVSGNG